ncbi:MAG: hypothetical protein J6P72_05025 [Firmicutes bacterium]|nr:hypothetical protein [Bacillota bacterium]
MKNRKLLPLFSTLVLLVFTLGLLTGCSSKPAVKVTNNLDQTIVYLTINSPDESDWGDNLLLTSVEPGHNVSVTFDKISEEQAGTFDVGILCENQMNYDTFEVYLGEGYEIGVASTGNENGDTVILTVTDANGHQETYEGYVYPNEE